MNRQTDGDDTVFDAVIQLLDNSSGDDKFTMDRLAEKTGISRATLYRRFGSREALLRRLAQARGVDIAELTRPDAHTRILKAARSVFGRYGLLGATIEQVAQEAQVGSATVYRHFGSKDGLIKAFIQSIGPRQAIQELDMPGGGNIEEDLIAFAIVLLQFIRDNRDIMRLILAEDEDTQRLLTRLRNAPDRTVHRLARYLEAQIRAGRLQAYDPQEMAAAFTGMLLTFGFFGSTFYDMPLSDPDHSARFITQLFLNGLSAGKPKCTQTLSFYLTTSAAPICPTWAARVPIWAR